MFAGAKHTKSPTTSTTRRRSQSFIAGQADRPLQVLAFNSSEGLSHDVSENIAREVLDRAVDADRNLSDGTKAFIDR
jgi:hypothetical protein